MNSEALVLWPPDMNSGLTGQEFEQTLRGSEGQGSLACCSPLGHKKSDMT